MKGILLSLTLLLFCYNSQSQENYTRTISVSDWVDEMVNCNTGYYSLENTRIELLSKRDSLLVPGVKWQGYNQTINCIVHLKNCKFPGYSFNLKGLKFKKLVFIMNCKSSHINFEDCLFDEGVEILWSDFGLTFFNNTDFNYEIDIYESDFSLLQFSKCNFNASKKHIYTNIDFGNLSIGYKNIFKVVSPDDKKQIKALSLDSCIINSDSVIPVIGFTLANIGKLHFGGLDFKNAILNFDNASIAQSLEVENCTINTPIGAANLSIPGVGTSLNWDLVENNGFAIYDEGLNSYYTAKGDSQLTNKKKYNNLIATYKMFHDMYKLRGDMESANRSYIAMKDIETRRFAFLYKKDKNLKNYFNWKLNSFLKYFCNYGTSPIRALIISMWVIIAFAVIFFFFDNDWDKINREYIINKYKGLLNYFQSDKKLTDYYAEKHDIEIKTYTEFRDYLNSSKEHIPKYLIWLGKPLYAFPSTRNMIKTYLYSKLEIIDGNWETLKPKRRFFANLITAGFIFLFILYALLSKAFNSIFLSINTFSTLGFGKIPVKGISKYLAILQGFIGWFLLSIFSVSLINQILQS